RQGLARRRCHRRSPTRRSNSESTSPAPRVVPADIHPSAVRPPRPAPGRAIRASWLLCRAARGGAARAVGRWPRPVCHVMPPEAPLPSYRAGRGRRGEGLVVVDRRTRAVDWLGPALMSLGFLVATLGGLTFSDCFSCTLAEVGSWWGGTLVVFVGAVIW